MPPVRALAPDRRWPRAAPRTACWPIRPASTSRSSPRSSASSSRPGRTWCWTTSTRSDNENQVDKSAPYTGNRKYSDGGYNGSTSQDCAADLDHNRWYRLARNLAAGTYRLQVTTRSTANRGSNLFNNSWITISIPLPNTYGQGSDDLMPVGETQPGWWKIEYTITASGNDTTTWEVNIRGNPVHLVP